MATQATIRSGTIIRTLHGGHTIALAVAAGTVTSVLAGNGTIGNPEFDCEKRYCRCESYGENQSNSSSNCDFGRTSLRSVKAKIVEAEDNKLFNNNALIRRNDIFATSSTVSSRFTHTPDNCFLFQPTKAEEDTLRSQKINLENEEARFLMALQKHQRLLEQYKEKWDYNKPTSRIPTTQWPQDIPTDDEIPALLSEQKYCKRSPNYRDDSIYCQQVEFRIATHYLLHTDDPKIQHDGLTIIKDLAERGHPDSMCLYGQILNEGRAGLDPNPTQGVVWLRRCAELHQHAQAIYEIGVAFYTGEGVIENECEAVKYFRLASDKGHPGASYLLGDCLLDGFGVERDRAEALERLIEAAERGHRGARSRVLAVLEHKEGNDFGVFTDASRQTLVSSVLTGGTESSASPEQIRFERRFTIGGEPANRSGFIGGVPPAATIARRKTQVDESRNL